MNCRSRESAAPAKAVAATRRHSQMCTPLVGPEGPPSLTASTGKEECPMKHIITGLLVIACYGCVVLAAKLFDYRAAALVLGGMLLSSAVLGLVESEG